MEIIIGFILIIGIPLAIFIPVSKYVKSLIKKHEDLVLSAHEELVAQKESFDIALQEAKFEALKKQNELHIFQSIHENTKEELTRTNEIIVSLQEEISNLKIQQQKEIKAAREDALKRSRSVNKGFSLEQFAPLISELPTGDFRHLGDPIDYLVCVGSEDIRNDLANEISEVVLLDIKTGTSNLNKTQRRIRDAIVDGRVSFAMYDPETENIRYWPEKKGKH